MTRIFILMCVAVATGLIATEQASAQPRVPYYQTRSPISPYLYLNRGSVGGVPSYYAWVRPQQELRDLAQGQQLQQQRVYGIERQLMVRPATEAASGVAQPGELYLRPGTFAAPQNTVGGYMNYSHFYPNPAVSPRSAASRRPAAISRPVGTSRSGF